MNYISYKKEGNTIQVNGNGLFSKGEVTVSINNTTENSGIVFILNNQRIEAKVQNVSNSTRNTVLSKGDESICLIEHFLSACSALGINDIEVLLNKNELTFGDGSAMHWYDALKDSSFRKPLKSKHQLIKPIFIKTGNKEIIAIPASSFKASYFMDWNHAALGKLWASWSISNDDSIMQLLKARTFANKKENDFFGISDWALTLLENSFNKELHEPLEPLYHKILDIIGDLRLSGINPLEINMHVIGFKSGHELNVELARELEKSFSDSK